MKKVLLPTDFSNLAHHAMGFALSYLKENPLAKSLVVLNSYFQPSTFSPEHLLHQHDEARQKSKDALKKEVFFLQGQASDSFTYEPLAHIGKLENIMSHLSKDKNIQLVLMGRDGIDRNFEDIYCPLFLIPEKAEYKGFSRICFLENQTDTLRFISEKKVNEILNSKPSQIFIISIQQTTLLEKKEENAVLSFWQHIYENIPHTYQVLKNESILEDLKSFVEINKIDLLISPSEITLPHNLNIPLLLVNKFISS